MSRCRSIPYGIRAAGAGSRQAAVHPVERRRRAGPRGGPVPTRAASSRLERPADRARAPPRALRRPQRRVARPRRGARCGRHERSPHGRPRRASAAAAAPIDRAVSTTRSAAPFSVSQEPGFASRTFSSQPPSGSIPSATRSSAAAALRTQVASTPSHLSAQVTGNRECHRSYSRSCSGQRSSCPASRTPHGLARSRCCGDGVDRLGEVALDRAVAGERFVRADVVVELSERLDHLGHLGAVGR